MAELTINEITRIVTEEFQVCRRDLSRPWRDAPLVRARQAVSWLARGDAAPPEDLRRWVALGASLAGLGAIGATGWLGGTLVYRYSMGRESEPEA